MNNMLKSLLVTALAVSASHVSAHTNRTFMAPRAQKASIVLDSAVAHDLQKTRHADRFGGNFLVRGFYSESNDAKAMGKYFGVAEQDVFNANIGNNVTANDVQLGYLVHDGALATAAAAAHGAKVTLAPKTVSYGVEFGYAQCLGKILEGLHLSVSLPVERIENNL
ncbi:hypothetical protein FJ364_05895, partial [Candidatus Dependentiae bacterium]|nr:hypothetical protein [Candidatus Dependentiae bacterium]